MSNDKKVEDRYTRVFGAYDIRGIVGDDLDSATIMAIARAYGDYICPKEPGSFLIGHDGRWSSPALAEAVSVGLRESGHRVTHVGLSSTPIVYWYGAEGGFDGSIAISASHLPAEYNGLKLCQRDALPLSGEHGLPEIEAMSRKTPKQSGRPSSELLAFASPLSQYIAHIRSRLKPARPLRIAVDAGNGMGGISAEALFSPFDTVELWRLSFHPDAYFSGRSPNPLEEGALDRLSETVKKRKLDFGLAFDGDADRAVVVDERGEMVPPDTLGGLIALHFLKDNPGAVILYDLRTSRAVTELIEAAGGRPIRSRVGHAFIKRAMRDNHAIFAMELSGHYYYSDLHYTDNGLRTLVELINIVSAEEKPLSELIKPFRLYPTSSEINLKVTDQKRIIAALENKYRDGHIDHLDGLSVDYPDWWFNVRSSHTESILRINIGATKKALLVDKRKILLVDIENISKGFRGQDDR
jgi:phosphomannomutase